MKYGKYLLVGFVAGAVIRTIEVAQERKQAKRVVEAVCTDLARMTEQNKNMGAFSNMKEIQEELAKELS